MEYACSIFRQIEDPGSFEYNTMIRGNVNNMNLEEALLLYVEMLERGIESDNFTYPFVFKACSLLGALKEGVQIHGHVFKAGLEGDTLVQNSLINMYGKCGEIKHAHALFEQMDERSVASWSAIIGSHASVEMWQECLMLLGDMSSEGRHRAEDSILVSALSACTHLGSPILGRCIHGILLRSISELNVVVKTSLLDMYVKCGCLEKGLCVFQNMAERNRFSYTVIIAELAIHGRGREALRVFSTSLEEDFNRMRFEHKIKPTVQHYGCMVDLMGRVGMLSEAYDLIKRMPIKPNDVVWRSLLSGLTRIKTEMAEKHLVQTPGFSLVEANRKVYKFVSQDKSKPQCETIYDMIHQMEWQLKFEGYTPDMSQVLLDVDEEEKRERLKYHSQKLAIVFALIRTSRDLLYEYQEILGCVVIVIRIPSSFP
ncbi:hypothetical protein Fmac_002863 [Flemingia macrophylla]|uniref:DYW domain-containing protein n=1 Tax=Flemingia macrophylla TaxID=520843 RepID=A0ABD1NLW7_9FABA